MSRETASPGAESAPAQPVPSLAALRWILSGGIAAADATRGSNLGSQLCLLDTV